MTDAEPTTAAAIRIVIAEDQELVRRGSALLLSMEPDMEVVVRLATASRPSN